MNLNLLYVKYFCDAVRAGGITAAAKANYVTQSAVSQGIAKLEKSLKCSLVARHPNRFRLTPEGQKAFQRMVGILKELEEFKNDFSQEILNIPGDLEFSCPHSFALAVITRHLKQFKVTYPQVKVNISCLGEPEEVIQALRRGLIDFGIIPGIENLLGFEQRQVHAGNYGLYVSSALSTSEEKKLGFILPMPEDTTAFQKAYVKKFGKTPSIAFEAGSWEVVARLSAEGLGIGYFPDYIYSKKQKLLRPSKIKLVLPSYKMNAIHLVGMKLRKSSEKFLEMLVR